MALDDRMIKTADVIREYFGKPVQINTWASGGDRRWSGLRDQSCTIGADISQHRYGRALDMIVCGIPAEEIRAEIIANQECFKYITRMEDGVSWLHIDCAPINHAGVYLFRQ
jgi:hypothetical protein